MKKYVIVFTILIMMTLCSCSSSPSSAQASDMKLKKYEGEIEVLNVNQKVEAVAGMNLYDGYGLTTSDTSYSWIDLDQTKLLKMDEKTKTSISKNDKKLKISVESGSLFFCVSETLKEEESLEFETRNASLSIRGTTGIVEAKNENYSAFLLIEGEAQIEADGKQEKITTGQKAIIRTDGEGKTQIQIDDIVFGGDVKDYVISEIENDTLVKQQILEGGGRSDYLDEEGKLALLERFTGTWRGHGYLPGDDAYPEAVFEIFLRDTSHTKEFHIRTADESWNEIKNYYAEHPDEGLEPPKFDAPGALLEAIKVIDENTIDLGVINYRLVLLDNNTISILSPGSAVTWMRVN